MRIRNIARARIACWAIEAGDSHHRHLCQQSPHCVTGSGTVGYKWTCVCSVKNLQFYLIGCFYVHQKKKKKLITWLRNCTFLVNMKLTIRKESVWKALSTSHLLWPWGRQAKPWPERSCRRSRAANAARPPVLGDVPHWVPYSHRGEQMSHHYW